MQFVLRSGPRRIVSIVFVALSNFVTCTAAIAETWVPLQFRQPMPIPYLVDVDGLRIDGSRRSLPAKWVLAPDSYQLGSWQFDCRSRTWRTGGAFTLVKGGAARPVALPASWRTAKAG